MARPSKRVSPDTLGGRIRAARQNLHLSLADVAKDRYSTSLISQIERNRIDPSPESLQFLAEKLKLPLEDLLALIQQRRESEAEAHRYKEIEEQRVRAAQLLEGNHAGAALEVLHKINIARVPASLRWRVIVLRGQCYFSQRHFRPALQDLLMASALAPDQVPQDQSLEVTKLHLYLAAAGRELGQLDLALEHYQSVLTMMKPYTPLNYVAEAHWGMAIVAFECANRGEHTDTPESLKQMALDHAGHASALYRSIGEALRADLLECQIAIIEQGLGDLQEARKRLQKVLANWILTLDGVAPTNSRDQRQLKERANVVSAAACYLAGIELEARRYEEALKYIHLSRDAAKKSYILRRAEAEMVLGQILEAMNPHDPEIERAFRAAIAELNPTDRIAAQTQAHDLLGRHLLKEGRVEEGEKELLHARRLSGISDVLSSSTTSAEDNTDNWK
ncbi:MAG: helix-turn-helix transcriptional regulator [Ktedonobacteraceae bacterium]|nr:helix-turn-helix transcriptional regulator [Ktedonobacteraceae bacterium]